MLEEKRKDLCCGDGIEKRWFYSTHLEYIYIYIEN